MRYSTWILAYSPIEGLVPFSCKLTEPVWWILQRYLVTVHCLGTYLRVLCFSMLSLHLQLHIIKSQRSLQQGRGMLRLLLFWSSFGVNFKKHCYLPCSTCPAARYLQCIFDALEKSTCICGALNKSKLKAQHAVVNSIFAVSNAKSTTHAKTTFPLKDFCRTFGTVFPPSFVRRTPAIEEWYCLLKSVLLSVLPR